MEGRGGSISNFSCLVLYFGGKGGEGKGGDGSKISH